MTFADMLILHYGHGSVSLTFWGVFLIVLLFFFIAGKD